MTPKPLDDDRASLIIEALIEKHGIEELRTKGVDEFIALIRTELEAGETLHESAPSNVEPSQVTGREVKATLRVASTRAERKIANKAAARAELAALERAKRTPAAKAALADKKATRTKENRKKYFLVEDTLLDNTWSEGEQRLMGEIALREQSNSYFSKLQYAENLQVKGVQFDSLVEEKIESSIARANTIGQILSQSELFALRKKVESDVSGLGEKLAEGARKTITTRINYLSKLDDEELVKAAARVALRMEMNLEYADTVDFGESGADLTKPKSQFEEQKHIKQLRAAFEKIFDRLRGD